MTPYKQPGLKARWLTGMGYAMLVSSLLAMGIAGPDMASAIKPDAGPGPGVVMRPLVVGERLEYAINLLAIPAGSARMEVQTAPAVGGRAKVKLVTTAESNDFVSLFFPVKNRVESWIGADDLLPDRLRFWRREGNRREDFDVVFDRRQGKATIVKNGATSERQIPRDTHGPLSCLYFLRSVPRLLPGTAITIPIHHDRKNYEVEVRVETLEYVSGPWGRVEAIRVLVVMPFRGIFLNEGNLRIWLTNDERRVPIVMQAKVIVGSVRAVLQSLPL